MEEITHPPGSAGDLGQRFGSRTIAAVVLLLATMVLIGVTTTLAWWTVSSSSGSSSAWYLGDACSGGTCTGYDGYPALHDTFGLTSDLAFGALALSVATLIFLLVSAIRPRWATTTLLTGVIGSLLQLAAPLYLFAALPGAMNASGDSSVTSFFGSATSPGFFGFGAATYTWGGGSGWYLALVVFVLFLASTAIAVSAVRRLGPMGDANLQMARYAAPPSPAPFAAPLPGRFCPTCGTHYPAGTPFCSRDATPLKDIAS